MSANNYVLIVSLGTLDLNGIKKLTGLATGKVDTFVSVSVTLVDDMVANDVALRGSSAALQVASYVEDRVEPELLEFCLNMDSGVLTKTFSETVNGSSTIASELTIQNDATAASASWPLVTTNATSAFDTVVRITLVAADLNFIKNSTDLASSQGDTFLSLTPSLLRDMNMNPVVNVGMTNAKAENSAIGCHVTDATSPQLESFDFDFDKFKLTLSFSETIDM
jgi:hypothetical protein